MAPKKTDRGYFIDKLYKGEIKRIKSKNRKKKERINPDSAQGKNVIQKCEGRCVICRSSYVRDPHAFNIHHINGNPEDTRTQNLTLMCSKCHDSIHGDADGKIRDYKANINKKKSNGSTSGARKQNKQNIVSVTCPACDGSGGILGFKTCEICHGKGRVQIYDPPKKCTVCKGSGGEQRGFYFDPCTYCGGTGYQNAVIISKKSG